ncbi:MAG: O-antigen ligase family protein [Candidatus Izemoplasmataceae bacterium]
MTESIKKVKNINIILTTLSIILILLGLMLNRIFLMIGISIIFINLVWMKEYALYSILILLFAFYATNLTNNLTFDWSLLFYVVAILIIGTFLVKLVKGKKIKVFYADKYFYLMLIILAWGTLSAIFSINTLQSFKNILSIFLVFVIFYIIPRHFHSRIERLVLINYIIVPLIFIISMISLVNLLVYFNLFTVSTSLFEWNISSAIYINSNGYGQIIMLTLISTNLLFIIDKELSNENNKGVLKKFLILSYPVLVLNLLLSGSRASILATIIAFIPIMLIRKKASIVIGGLGVLTLLNAEDNLLLLRKLEFGIQNNRWDRWVYGFGNVIAKYPILGIGAGASIDHGVPSVHNAYLNMIMSLGMVGFFLWIQIIFFVFYRALRIKERKYLFIFTLLGIMFYSLFENSLFGGMRLLMSIFWMIVLVIESMKVDVLKRLGGCDE